MPAQISQIIAKGNGNREPQDIAVRGQAPVRVKAQPGVKYQIQGEDGYAPENMTVSRVGDDLLITAEGETQPGVIIEGYFAQAEPAGVYGLGEDGQLHLYVRTDGEGGIFVLADGEAEAAALSSVPYAPGEDAGFAWGALIPLLLLGGLGLAALLDDDDDDPVVVQPGGNAGIDAVDDNEGDTTGPVPDGGVTDDGTPEIGGHGTPGSEITVIDNGVPIGTAKVGPDGNWTFVPEVELPDGQHNFTVVEKPPGGVPGPVSPPYTITIDDVAPDAPAFNVTDDVGAITGEVVHGSTIDDVRPVISGVSEPGAKITIYDNGVMLGTTMAGPEGQWTFEPETDLLDGKHSITTTATDSATNESAPAGPRDFIIDTKAPEAPKIVDATDDKDPITGSVGNGGATDDSTPTLTGTAEPGSTVTVYDSNDTPLGTTTTSPEGTWTFTPSAPLPEGQHDFTVTATDDAGNISPESPVYTVTTDYTAPDQGALSITGYGDDVGGTQGNVLSGGKSDDATPLITGKGTAGDTVFVSVTDSSGTIRELGSATVDANGDWKLQLDGANHLNTGPNAITAVERDPVGNMTAPTGPYNVEVVLPHPQPPVIDTVEDDAGDETGFLQKGDVTDDQKPIIKGTAEPGTVVHVYEDTPQGVEIGSAQVDANGNWTLEPVTDLAEGPHNIVAVAVDDAGQASDPTGVWNFVVDITAPPAGPYTVIDNVGGSTGLLVDGSTTDDNKPEITGTGQEPGAEVTVIIDGKPIGTAEVKPDGTWSLTPTEPLPEGPNTITTQVEDPAGNTGPESPPTTITVDTSKLIVTLDTVYDDNGPVTGFVAMDGVTDDTLPLIAGSGKVGAIVTVSDGTTVLGSTVVGPDGKWSLPVPADKALIEGPHTIKATAVDAAGNTGESTVHNFTVDTTAPAAPVIVNADDDVGAVKGSVANGGATDDPSPTLDGTAEPNSIVKVYDNGNYLGSVNANPDGTWEYTPTLGLPEGPHDFTATSTDEAGNESGKSPVYAVTIDFTPPGPADFELIDDQGSKTGPIPEGSVTDDTQPEVKGTAEPGTTVTVYDNGALLGTADVDSNGNWTLTPEKPLPNGKHDFTTVVTDDAGNQSPMSPPKSIVIVGESSGLTLDKLTDDQPEITGSIVPNGVTDDRLPLVEGTGTPGATVTVSDGQTVLGSATVNPDGTWSFQVPVDKPLVDGPHTITASSVDPAGNTANAGPFTFIVDDTVPVLPTIDKATDDVLAITGTVPNGGLTNDDTPLLEGKAEAGSTVALYDNGVKLVEVKADANGTWSYALPAPGLADGLHDFAVTSTDAAGNTTEKSPVYSLTVDTVAPNLNDLAITAYGDDQSPVGAVPGTPVIGDVASGGQSDDDTPTIKGTGTSGDTITVSVANEAGVSTVLGSAVVGSDGTWQLQVTNEALIDTGDNKFTAVAMDPAGNSAGPTAAFNVDVTEKTYVVNKVTTSNTQMAPEITALKDGSSVVVFESAGGDGNGTAVFIRLLDANGVPVGDDFVLNNTTVKTQASPDVTVLSNGDIEVVWHDNGIGGDFTIKSQTLTKTADGLVEQGDETWVTLSTPGGAQEDTLNQNNPTIAALNDGGYVTVFESNLDVATQEATEWHYVMHQFDASGAQVATFDIAKSGVTDPFAVGSPPPYITVLANGDAVIAYTRVDTAGNHETYARVVDVTGQGTVGAEFMVNQITANNQIVDSVTALADNKFLVTWTSTSTAGADNSTSGVWGRIYQADSTGGATPVASEFLVNTATSGAQADSSVAVDPSGNGFAVAYTSPDAAGSGIFVQYFNNAGQKVGSEVQVNEWTGSDQTQPSIAFTADGQLQVAWTDATKFDNSSKAILTRTVEFDADTGFTVLSAPVAERAASDDVVTITDTEFANAIDGGAGLDTLLLGGEDMHIDLSALGAQVQGFEKFDLGAGSNSLALSAADVEARGAADLIIQDGNTQLVVNGSAGEVQLNGAEDWSSVGTTTAAGVNYSVYTNTSNTAELLIEDKVQVTIL